MKLIYILLISLFSITSYSQTYNKVDTTWTLNYKDVSKIRDTINTITSELILLDSISKEKTLKINKLETSDTLQKLELEKYEELVESYRSTLIKSNGIINWFKAESVFMQDRLKIEENKLKKETTWKNVYKYGYPVAAIITTILILK